ncbi:MAG: hypothetical protein ACXV2D_01625 [Halobacteriota archaeon]
MQLLLIPFRFIPLRFPSFVHWRKLYAIIVRMRLCMVILSNSNFPRYPVREGSTHRLRRFKCALFEEV